MCIFIKNKVSAFKSTFASLVAHSARTFQVNIPEKDLKWKFQLYVSMVKTDGPNCDVHFLKLCLHKKDKIKYIYFEIF